MVYICLPLLPCLDVALVTSLRDGMNLVSYEFVACQDAKKGVLILSEVNSGNLLVCLKLIYYHYATFALHLHGGFLNFKIKRK